MHWQRQYAAYNEINKSLNLFLYSIIQHGKWWRWRSCSKYIRKTINFKHSSILANIVVQFYTCLKSYFELVFQYYCILKTETKLSISGEPELNSLNLNIYRATLRKVVGKKAHVTIPKGNMGCDQYTVHNNCGCWTYFCCFPLAHANISPWPLVPFLLISLKNSDLKTTHNTFQDCCVLFFRQPFSK